MANHVEPHVSSFNVNQDNSVALEVQIVGIAPGGWAEISGYLIQSPEVFVPFSDIQQVPGSTDGAPSVTVNVSAPELNPDAEVQVITRVTQAWIWPTTLKMGQAQPGARQTWVAVSYGAGQQGSQPSQMTASPSPTASAPGPNPSITWTDPQSGITYTVTLAAVPK